MVRADQVEVTTHLGDQPPILPISKPFDLSWQRILSFLPGVLLAIWVSQLGLPVKFANYAVYMSLLVGAALCWYRPKGRALWDWVWSAIRYRFELSGATYLDTDGKRHMFEKDARKLIGIEVLPDGTGYLVLPPLWGLIKRIGLIRKAWWERWLPYRGVLEVLPQGNLKLLHADERVARMSSLAAALRGLLFPLQFIILTRRENAKDIADHAVPPPGSPFSHLSKSVHVWALEQAKGYLRPHVFVVVSAAYSADLEVRFTEAERMLDGTKMRGERCQGDELRALLDQTWGPNAEEMISGKRKRGEELDNAYDAFRFSGAPFPWHRPSILPQRDSIIVNGEEWTTIVIRVFPRTCIIGWVSSILSDLGVDLSLSVSPDNAWWVGKVLEWFEGFCLLHTADFQHRQARDDLARVDAARRNNEGGVLQTSLTLTVPTKTVPEVTNRLRIAGAESSTGTFLQSKGRRATTPSGVTVGPHYPLDLPSVAATYPFGTNGLYMLNGRLIGRAVDSPEGIILDPREESLFASSVVILGATGAGKTFFAQLLLARLGLPFVCIDQKLHLSNEVPGEYYRFVKEAGGVYSVVGRDEVLQPHPVAQGYNLSALETGEAQSEEILRIGKREFARQKQLLTPRGFLVDEAWLLGRSEAGKLFAETVAREGRSVNWVPIFISQEVMDFLGDPRMSAVVKQSYIVVVLALDATEIEVVADRLKLNEDAKAYLYTLMPQPGNKATVRRGLLKVGPFLYKIQIEACPEEYALFSTRPRDELVRRQVLLERQAIAA